MIGRVRPITLGPTYSCPVSATYFHSPWLDEESPKRYSVSPLGSTGFGSFSLRKAPIGTGRSEKWLTQSHFLLELRTSTAASHSG